VLHCQSSPDFLGFSVETPRAEEANPSLGCLERRFTQRRNNATNLSKRRQYAGAGSLSANAGKL
jgi:hypothetical protein